MHLAFAIALLLSASDQFHPDLHAQWNIVAGKSETQPQFRGELTISHSGEMALSKGWMLGFNFPWPLSIDPKALFTLEHVNGDYYRLLPRQDTVLQPGGSVIIPLFYPHTILSSSLIPDGLFFASPEYTQRVSLTTVPIPDHLMTRGRQDLLPVETAEVRFYRNRETSTKGVFDAPPITPTVQNFSAGKGIYTLKSGLRIGFADSLRDEARMLQFLLKQHFNQDAIMAANRIEPPEIILEQGKVSLDGTEAYELTVGTDGIRIRGASPTGVFYGVQTLLSLAPWEAYRDRKGEWTCPAATITDAPRFAYRGFHLDVARNFQSKETVKKLLDLMAFYKLNRFHFHLTDDEGWRVEIRDLPELTEIGAQRGVTSERMLPPSFGSGPFPEAPGSGYYSREEFIEILRYANARHIEVIPEIDMPGHARAAIEAMKSRPEYALHDPEDQSVYSSVQRWRDNVVCPCKGSTYNFLDKVFDELREMYRTAGAPLRAIHMGGDEVPKGVWVDAPSCRTLMKQKGWTDIKQVNQYFNERLIALVGKDRLVTGAWEEVVLHGEHGDKPVPNLAMKGKVRAYVWNDLPGSGREDMAYQLANNGIDVVLSSASHLYFDMTPGKDHEEPGYYWAAFTDTHKVFSFSPENLFASGDIDRFGKKVTWKEGERVLLNETGHRHLLGIQGQLWGETLKTGKSVEYMAFPRLLALAERAWAQRPEWETMDSGLKRSVLLTTDWQKFMTRMNQELPRLDHLFGGTAYRIPLPGARIQDGVLEANNIFPGLSMRYTLDGSEPTPTSEPYQGPVKVDKPVRMRTFDSRGRGSRTTEVEPVPVPPSDGKSAGE